MLVCSCSSVGVRALHLRFIFTAVQVAEGDVIGVRYKGTLDDGSVFDENPEGPLLEFEVGAGRVIRGFDDAVIGLKLGESRKVTCEPKDAYGEYDEKNVAEVPMEQMPTPPDGELKEGLVLQLQGGQIAVIKEVFPAALWCPVRQHLRPLFTSTLKTHCWQVGETIVKLDGNHPLAGKRLTFDVTVKEIKDRAEVLAGKLKEMTTVLDNPVMAMLAAEVTKNENYVDEVRKQIDEAEDKGATLNDVIRSEEWITITAALMSNPQLQQLLANPAAAAEIKRRMEAEDAGGVTADAGSAVPEAEFSEDK